MLAVLNHLLGELVYYGVLVIIYSLFESKRGRNILFEAFLHLLMVSPLMLIKYIFKDNSIINITALIAVDIANFLILNALMKGKVWKKILIVCLYSLTFMIGEMLLFMVFNEQIKEMTSWGFNNPKACLFYTLDSLIGTAIFYGVILIWKKIEKKGMYSIKRGLIFMIFPISQIFIMYPLNTYLFKGMADVNFSMISGFLLSLVADLIFLIILTNQDKMEEMNYKLTEIKHSWDIDKEYFSELEKKQKEMSQIRHDLNEQFIIMRDLASRDDKEGLNAVIDSMTKYLGSTRGNIYCGDATINALMAEYERICHEKGIALSYSLEVYAPLSINPVALCSIFSNILRNAIEATEGLEGEKNIHLAAAVKGGYFHIISDNDYDPNFKKKNHKGLGLEILGNIAEKLNGVFSTEKKDNKFHLVMSVENVNTEF